ncbi:MAG: hypothetical protein IKP42_03050 [Ruminococcus sp.]|nr:hypothetical protein [Ruminococcus sp.]
MENIIIQSALTASAKIAYLDPGTTTLIIEIIAGVVVTLATVTGIYWRKIVKLFKKNSPETDAPAADIKGADDGKDVITADDLLDDDDDNE